MKKKEGEKEEAEKKTEGKKKGGGAAEEEEEFHLVNRKGITIHMCKLACIIKFVNSPQLIAIHRHSTTRPVRQIKNSQTI